MLDRGVEKFLLTFMDEHPVDRSTVERGEAAYTAGQCGVGRQQSYGINTLTYSFSKPWPF